jgi:hypothetical protein
MLDEDPPMDVTTVVLSPHVLCLSRRVCVSVFSRCIYSSPPPHSILLLIYVTRPITCTVKLLEYRYIRGNACGLVFAAQL